MFESVRAARRLPTAGLRAATETQHTAQSIGYIAEDVRAVMPLIHVVVLMVGLAATVYIGVQLGTLVRDLMHP